MGDLGGRRAGGWEGIWENWEFWESWELWEGLRGNLGVLGELGALGGLRGNLVELGVLGRAEVGRAGCCGDGDFFGLFFLCFFE